uniref:Tyrosinase copper-binding domain-containing protein n=1 Tax=Acrobeloides nanus TaxID=290746 RepID=A0A914CBK1_9BILA
MGYPQALSNCHIPLLMAFNTSIEYIHGFVHIYVGGHMGKPNTTAEDPIFYMLHSYVDFIWELWRRQKQTREAREMFYAHDSRFCSTKSHFSRSSMQPWGVWGLTNIDGLSNHYTDNLYDYGPRPICPDCMGSKYLFCDRSTTPFGARCSSKIKIGGNCVGKREDDGPCFQGVCENGRCVLKKNLVSYFDSKPNENEERTVKLIVDYSVGSDNLIMSRNPRKKIETKNMIIYFLTPTEESEWLYIDEADIVFQCRDAWLCGGVENIENRTPICWSSNSYSFESYILRPFCNKNGTCAVYVFHGFSNDNPPERMYEDQVHIIDVGLKSTISNMTKKHLNEQSAPGTPPIPIDRDNYISIDFIHCGTMQTVNE